MLQLCYRRLSAVFVAGYTHERYREIIHSIRRYMPDASVSGDAIVGFPGEGTHCALVSARWL